MKKLFTVAGLAIALAFAGRAPAQNYSLIHFGGDICTSSAWNSQSVCKINGTSIPVNSAADQVIVTTAAATAAWKVITDCTDTAGNHLNYTVSTHTWSCGTSVPSGGGSVTSVNASGGGIFSFTGGPVTTTGTLALTVAGTSGGIPYFSSASALSSSAALTANALVLGGGAGGTPTVVGSLGTTTTLLHGNASGAPAFSAVSLTADVANTLPSGNGGTGSAFFGVAGPSSSVKTYTFPNASATVLTDNAAVTVAQGGTGLASGTSGGIPYFSGSTTIASSAALTQYALVIGGGAGATPAVVSGLGTTTQVLHGNASAAPAFSALVASDLPASSKVRSFGTTFGDTAGSVLTSGSVVYFTIPYSCTISAWNATVDAGTVTFDIWKIATGTAVPTVANTITASALPAISTGTALHSTTLTSWTTSVSANDIVGIKLQTVATAKYAELDVECDQ